MSLLLFVGHLLRALDCLLLYLVDASSSILAAVLCVYTTAQVKHLASCFLNRHHPSEMTTSSMRTFLHMSEAAS